MRVLFLLIIAVFASENKKINENSEPSNLQNSAQNEIVVKIEEEVCTKKQTSQYFGVGYRKKTENWRATRWSSKENKNFYNGSYEDEEDAAHASDTLARTFIANGEKDHKLNFPDDQTEVYPEKTSAYFGVSYYKHTEKWRANRWSKNEHKNVHNGFYKDEVTAAHASDTLARKLIKNGEKGLKLNFPDDDIEVKPEKTSNYLGVSYNKQNKAWAVKRWSKRECKNICNGASYKDEETAAHASDTLARKLIKNGEKGLKLNFPDDDTEVNPNPKEKTSIYVGVTSKKQNGRWRAYRKDKSKNNMTIFNGTYKDEITAAHASDTLARKLMKNGEKGLKLNFPDDNTEVYPEIQEQTSNYFGVTYNKQKESWAARRWSKIENKMVCRRRKKSQTQLS